MCCRCHTNEFLAQAPEAFRALIRNAKQIVEQITKKAEVEGIKAQGLVREGEKYEVIANIANEENSDLIIIGSHGRTAFERILVGSVTEKVVGFAPCPVLVFSYCD
nr:universal stress protein [Desulfobacterales bacterium]